MKDALFFIKQAVVFIGYFLSAFIICGATMGLFGENKGLALSVFIFGLLLFVATKLVAMFWGWVFKV